MLRSLAVLLVALVIGMLPALDHAGAQPKPIRIGEINSYSGVATVYTFPYKEGLALAAKEINDAGGVLGRPLEFIHRGDKLKPDEAVKAARELPDLAPHLGRRTSTRRASPSRPTSRRPMARTSCGAVTR